MYSFLVYVPHQTRWSPAVCKNHVAPIIYENFLLLIRMFVNNREYRVKLNQILRPRFITLVIIFFENSHEPKLKERRTDISGTCAAGRILCTWAADRRSNTNVYCINVALVFEYGTMITYCIKYCDKLSVDPVRNLFKQTKDVGHVARCYLLLLYLNNRQLAFPSTNINTIFF